MTLYLPELDQLDVAVVRDYQNVLRKWLEEAHPQADFRGGVLHDLVLHLHAIVFAGLSQAVVQLRREQSLPWLLAHADRARPQAVDDLLANMGLQRRGAETAGGSVTVVLDRPQPLTVSVSERFEARGILFRPLRNYAVKLDPGNLTGEDDRLLVAFPDGKFAFTIQVTSSEPGARGRLQRNEPLRMLAPFPGFVRAYAAEDFQGGAESETSAELLQRWKLNFIDKAHSGRLNMSAWLRQQDVTERISAQSIIGFGDAEMRRDRHAIWPGSLGGRVDWYVRTRPLPVVSETQVAAVLLEQTPTGGIWRISLPRDALPACYELVRAVPVGRMHATELLRLERGYDPSPLAEDGWAPDIQSESEAAFSPFQTLIVDVRDPQTPSDLAPGARQEWTVQGLLMPGLRELQQRATASAVRPVGSDLLLRAPIPCFLSISATIQITADHLAPDLELARHRVASALNELSFVDQIPAAVVINQLQELLNPPSTVAAVELLGRLLTPDGETIYLHGREALPVPQEPHRGISSRTVCCFCDPRHVSLTVARSPTPPTPMF